LTQPNLLEALVGHMSMDGVPTYPPEESNKTEEVGGL